jgi:hypothetical protein
MGSGKSPMLGPQLNPQWMGSGHWGMGPNPLIGAPFSGTSHSTSIPIQLMIGPMQIPTGLVQSTYGAGYLLVWGPYNLIWALLMGQYLLVPSKSLNSISKRTLPNSIQPRIGLVKLHQQNVNKGLMILNLNGEMR